MKSRQLRHPKSGKPALSTLSLAVVATLIASGAQAAPEPVEVTGTSISGDRSHIETHGNKIIEAVTLNPNDVSADITDTRGTITAVGPQTGTSNTTTANLIGSTAAGNSAASALDLATRSATSPDGLVIHTVSVDTGAIHSTVDNNTLSVELDGFVSGTATNTGNTISAATTVNRATATIAGAVQGGVATTTPASSRVNTAIDATDLSVTNGGLVVTTVQQASALHSGAVASNNVIGIDLSTAGEGVVASPVLTGNAISAAFKGNSATNAVALQAGGAPAFTGSVAVTNLQGHGLAGDVPVADGSAVNASSLIVGQVSGATLYGVLSVKDNAIGSTATGNEVLGQTGLAGNRIVLGDSVSFHGNGVGPASVTAGYTGSAMNTQVAADLLILNGQNNVNADVSSVTASSAVVGEVYVLDGGGIAVSGNSATSAANGNVASSSIANGANAAAFAGTAAVANQQGNDNSQITANTEFTLILATAGTNDGAVNASTVSVTDNRTSATAFGNEVSQSLALEATTLSPVGAIAALSTTTGADAAATATGIATVSNLQRNVASPVTALGILSVIGLQVDAGGVNGDTLAGNILSVAGNTQEAVAVGSSAANALSLKGNTIGSGAGVLNVQTGDEASSVLAGLGGAVALLYAGTHVQDSALSLSGNLQRAIGYGTSATNTLNVAGTTIVLPIASGVPASTVDEATGVPTVMAAYGVLSSQSIAADVAATTTALGGFDIGLGLSPMGVLVEGNLTRSSVKNDLNTSVAAAYGNDATSALTLALGNVASGDFASVGNVTSVQAVNGTETTVTASVGGGQVVGTQIDDHIVDSSVSTSGNTVQALALGNHAATRLAVTGGSIDTALHTGEARGGAGVVGTPATLITDASFSLQNVQVAQGAVIATQRLEGGLAASTGITIGLDDLTGRQITNSSVAGDANRSIASATANSAANALSLAVNTAATTSAVQNLQRSAAAVSALIGAVGTPASPGGDFGFTVSRSGVIGYDGEGHIDSGTLNATLADVTPAKIAGMTELGWTYSGVGGVFTWDTGSTPYAADSATYVSLLGAGTLPGIVTTAATAATAGQGGVTLAIAGSGMGITGSKLSVSNNVTSGSVTGNSASSSLSIAANSIANGSGRTFSEAGVQGDVVGAQADHAMSNVQIAQGSALTSDVVGSFAIDTANKAAITGSTLSVVGNSQTASAVANTATNAVSLGGAATTRIAAGSALISLQQGFSAVTATSTLDLFTPAGVTDSTVAISGNANSALAVANDVANTVLVTATHVAAISDADNANAIVSGIGAKGDHVLANRQGSTAPVSSVAQTHLYSKDADVETFAALLNSTATVSGNTTAAEASANRALNSLSVIAGATQGATAGLLNNQDSAASVTASATTAANLAFPGVAGDALALNGSTVSLAGNSTTALARGNTATNALVMTAGSGYGAAPGVASSVAADSAQASAIVLNTQHNGGAVAASSSQANYLVALNSGGISNGAIGVVSNGVAAEAYGNSASNRVTLSALNGSTPTAGVASYQTNSGAVSATVSSAYYGSGITGGAVNSAVRVSGNQITASATGNSVMTSIVASR